MAVTGQPCGQPMDMLWRNGVAAVVDAMMVQIDLKSRDAAKKKRPPGSAAAEHPWKQHCRSTSRQFLLRTRGDDAPCRNPGARERRIRVPRTADLQCACGTLGPEPPRRTRAPWRGNSRDESAAAHSPLVARRPTRRPRPPLPPQRRRNATPPAHRTHRYAEAALLQAQLHSSPADSPPR